MSAEPSDAKVSAPNRPEPNSLALECLAPKCPAPKLLRETSYIARGRFGPASAGSELLELRRPRFSIQFSFRSRL